jgi:hypothetical protein
MYCVVRRLSGYALADARSLALHREIARRLRADPGLLQRARDRVLTWQRSSQVASTYVEAWRLALEAGLPAVLEVLEDPSERGQALRQASPFAYVIPARERWQLLAQLGAGAWG